MKVIGHLHTPTTFTLKRRVVGYHLIGDSDDPKRHSVVGSVKKIPTPTLKSAG